MADFNQAIEIILKHEGGYVNDPDDPGGETNYGISKRQYPSLDIKNLTRDVAAQIYRHDYWLSLYDSIQDQRIAAALLDFGVNAGTETAINTLQKALGDIMAGPILVDGVFGPATLSAVNGADAERLLKQFTVRRITYYSSLNRPKYIRGWIQRALDYA